MPPNQREINQREIQRRLMERHNIFYGDPVESEANPRWPRSFNQIFQAVRELGKREYAEYSETITANIAQAPWKAQAQLRADCVRRKAKQCLDTRKNESGWRTSLENRIMARFDTEVACRKCRNRLWRSELEATAANPMGSDDHYSLGARQSRRQPCKCYGAGGISALLDNGISPIFDDRAEQGIICSPARPGHLPKREVRPDRVYGLQTTKRFGRLLGLTPGVRSNPFKPDGEALIFPFLVIEAKSEKAGSSNSDIQLQTGFAIRELLMIQDELGEAAEDGNWHGGPLVWFVSYRGEDWRVSAAYVHKKAGQISFRVVRLWQGCLDSLDKSLQLLLIIDYIADWARDIYREGVASSLQKLAASDSASLAHDEDIYSKSGGLRSRASSLFTASRPASRFGGSRAPSHFDFDPVPSQHDISNGERNQVVTKDPLHKFDHESGVLRDSRCIHSRLKGLFITHENIEEFLHTERKGPEVLPPEELFYTLITVTFYLTPDWEPTRELNYLAVSQTLIRDLIQSSLLSTFHAHNLEMSPVFQNLQGFEKLLRRTLVHSLYHMYKVGRNEPNIPFLRVSSALDQAPTPEKLGSDLFDKTNWPWANDPKLKRLRGSNKHSIVAMPEFQGTYYKSDVCIFLLDVNSEYPLDIPMSDIFRAPDTYIRVYRFNADPEDGHRPWKTESLDEEVQTWSLGLGVQVADDMRLLIEHLDTYSQHLKKTLGMLSIGSWDELARGLVFNEEAKVLVKPSRGPSKRQTYDSSTKSMLLELGWHKAWNKVQSRLRGKINNCNEIAVQGSTADPADMAVRPMQEPTPDVGHGSLYNNQDDDGLMDRAVMSERRRGKRPMGVMDTLDEVESSVQGERRRGKRPMRAVDESDVAESSAHAERRARRERQGAQRFNNDFLSDEQLEEVLADGVLS
ncbi:hypothetical protein FBULB1_7279 [Fusarium bulbicola]|nr:hypothetical protein FBULB1_7279 [Fusarium bulbicola]